MAIGVRHVLALALLLLVAAAYFALGVNLTLEWADEGHIIYGSWRTSEGALPYREFRHLYGPSLFFLNGALFRLFGADLVVVRTSMIVIKSVIAVLVFCCARRIAPLPMALLAYAFTVALWGLPLWLVAAPYAQYHATLLNLAGLLLVVTLRTRPRAGAVLAGLCFGLASTFKQTTGVFAAIALLWFVIAQRTDHPGVAGPMPGRSILRPAALVSSLLVLAACASKNPDVWTRLVLLTPALVCVVLLLAGERRAPPTADDRARGLSRLAWCGGAMMVPWLGYGLLYASAADINGMLRDLAIEIPMRMSIVASFPRPSREVVVAFIALAGALVAPRWFAAPPSRAGNLAFVASSGLLGMASLWLAWPVVDGRTSWFLVLMSGLYWLPPLAVWLALPAAFRAPPASVGGDAGAFRLFCFYGVVSLLFLSPVADIGHLLHGLPIFLILCAHHLGALWSAAGDARHPGPTRAATAVVIAGLAVAVLLPCLDRLRIARTSLADGRPALARASGVFDPRPEFGHEIGLVEWLRDDTRRDRAVFALGSPQMLYFLIGKPSPLEHDEFTFFLASFAALPASDARAMVNQDAVVATLRRERPLVVDGFGGAAGRRFRDVFPTVTAYLDQHYRPLARFGPYTVLDAAPEHGAPPF